VDGNVVEGEGNMAARRAGVQQQSHGPATVTTTRYATTTTRTMRLHLREITDIFPASPPGSTRRRAEKEGSQETIAGKLRQSPPDSVPQYHEHAGFSPTFSKHTPHVELHRFFSEWSGRRRYAQNQLICAGTMRAALFAHLRWLPSSELTAGSAAG
jgi:hypothetical protein